VVVVVVVIIIIVVIIIVIIIIIIIIPTCRKTLIYMLGDDTVIQYSLIFNIQVVY